MLPKDFPKWRSVHAYFQIWSEQVNDQPSLLERALKKIGRRNSS
jgi:ketosteroid isomerase-like protein